MLFGLPLYRINFGLDAVNTACQTSQTGICLFQTFKYSGNRCLTLGQGGSQEVVVWLVSAVWCFAPEAELLALLLLSLLEGLWRQRFFAPGTV